MVALGNPICKTCGQRHPMGFDCIAANEEAHRSMIEAVENMGKATLQDDDGWNYETQCVPEGDARKIVTLEEDGMTWVGIRAFDHQRKRWINNGEPERASVKAWRDLPNPARGFWFRGQLQTPTN